MPVVNKKKYKTTIYYSSALDWIESGLFTKLSYEKSWLLDMPQKKLLGISCVDYTVFVTEESLSTDKIEICQKHGLSFYAKLLSTKGRFELFVDNRFLKSFVFMRKKIFRR